MRDIPLSVEMIELRVERMMDALDEMLGRHLITVEEYDESVQGVYKWSDDQYARRKAA